MKSCLTRHITSNVVSFDFYTNLFDCHEPTIRFYWREKKCNSTKKISSQNDPFQTLSKLESSILSNKHKVLITNYINVNSKQTFYIYVKLFLLIKQRKLRLEGEKKIFSLSC